MPVLSNMFLRGVAMSRGFVTAVTSGVMILACLLVGLKAVTAPAADGREPAGTEAPGEGVFGQTRVWAVHLGIPAKEYEAMQPPGGGFGFPGGPGGPPQPREKRERDSERNLFGVEFPWAH